MSSPPNEITLALADIRKGDSAAVSRLMELVYAPLRDLARRYFRAQPGSHTLQPTALVHEVFLKMVGKTDVEWRDRAHFLAVCATAMRGILADHARRRAAAKRGGDRQRVTLSGQAASAEAAEVDALHLDEVLSRLAELHERQAKIVEYRFFAGMTIEEVAEALGVSSRTVNDDWTMARAWMSVRLSESA